MSAIEMLNPEACECHSPQEQRIFDELKGKKDKSMTRMPACSTSSPS